MRRIGYSLIVVCMAALQPVLAPVSAQELPDFGSPADSVLTRTQEKMIGRSVILQLRNANAIIDDPQLNEYIRLLGSKLASQVNDGDYEFEFFVIDDDTVNAFAMPGAVIGVNAGLLLATENESELAGALAHEVSHVTQRHIARSLADRQRSGMMSLATSLAAILIASAADASSQATMGAVTASQAATAQRQINFTRAHEYEADRIGMGVLARAGFSPDGMADFFEKLSRRESAAGATVPEMLRTHPSSTGRISEARMRARQMPAVNHEDSTAYGLAKARLRVLSARTPERALAYYRERADSPNAADQYGYALSLMGMGLEDRAERIFRELSQDDPSVIAYRIGRAEALMSAGADEQAMNVYREANALSPRNIPLVISYGEALLNAGRAGEAHKLLLDLLNNVNPTPAQIELLARAASAEGDMKNAHHYMSEYFASIGNLPLAITQLEMALDSPGVNTVEHARFVARIDEFREYLEEMER